MVPSLQTNETKSSSRGFCRRRRTHKSRPSQPLQSMQRSSPPHNLQITLHKQARRDVSALAFDKSRLYTPLFSAKRNNRSNRNHRNSRTGMINRTGTGRADLIKLFINAMSCIVSDHIQTYNGSKQRLSNKQTNKQTMAEESTTRKITLREFKPESYKVWEIATKATLRYNKLFDIVDGTLTDPTPRDDNGAILRPIPGALKDQVEKWKHDHERTREAIIRCLPDSELLKLDDVQDDVTAIWKHINDEYGRASNDLTNIKKDEKTTINDHINKFEQLVYEVNYNVRKLRLQLSRIRSELFH